MNLTNSSEGKIMSSGIDYGRGITNRDADGVSFGIIHTNKLPGWIWDDFEPNYGDVPEDSEEDDFAFDCEPLSHEYDRDGLKLMIDSDGDLWVMASPHRSTGTHCSPCAPGAVSLGTDGDVPCLALPSDWFDEDNPCPYAITTGHLAKSEPTR